MIKRKKPVRLPTDREISLMLSKIAHPRTQLIMILALKLGLRASEIVNLRITDIDFENRTVSFVGKGNKPAILPLTDEVMGYLERALKARPTSLKHDFLIWDLRKNKGISRFGVFYLVRKYGKAVGIKLWPHLLRHKFGTDVAKKGDIHRAKEALRHARLSTTSEVYAHLSVEDQRKDFELLDSRHWLIRFLSKLKPPIPSFLLEKPAPVFTETIGRREELAKLSANLKAGIHTVLCGPRGVGKSHLLRQAKGEGIFCLDDLRPVREKLVQLCERMKEAEVLQEVPKGRGTSSILHSLTTAMEGKHYTLVIDSISDITKDGVALLRKLKEHFTVFASVDLKHRSILSEIFFGSHETMEIGNLASEDAFRLADMASIDLPTTPEGRELFLRRVVAESRGNPKAIMEIIDKERRRGKVVDASTEITHEAAQEPLPATLFLSVFLVIAIVARYGASSLGMPDVKIILIVAIIATSTLLLIDKILKQDK